MLIQNHKILKKAQKEKYGVGAFNINNLEFLKAVLSAAEELKSPVIIQTTEGAIKYAGIEYLVAMMQVAAKTKIPIGFHLDHGKDLNTIKQCIKLGYKSVMIDGSHYDFKKNIKVTSKVVKWAHSKSVSVEAELGTIGGVEDNVSSKHIIYTDPKTAKEFVQETKCDCLAIAIGTSHGAYKFKGKSELNHQLLKKIKKIINIPLVLHGASSIYPSIVKKANKYGAHIKGAKGVDESQLKKAVKGGICKVNIDSDLRLAFNAGIREYLHKNPSVFDPRKILGAGSDEITEIVKQKIIVLGSKNKA